MEIGPEVICDLCGRVIPRDEPICHNEAGDQLHQSCRDFLYHDATD